MNHHPKISIPFENAHFIVAIKPSGWLTVPSRMGVTDTRPCLGIELQRMLNQQIYPIHRLDEPVSGLVIFAKTAAAHRAANTWFEQGNVIKEYVALSQAGISLNQMPSAKVAPIPPIGVMQEWRDQILRGKKRAYPHAQRGKACVTQAILSNVTEQILTWSLFPLTGRSHQLRYALSSRGFPIIGDALYGSEQIWEDKSAIALCMMALDLKKCPGREQFSLPEQIRMPKLPWSKNS